MSSPALLIEIKQQMSGSSFPCDALASPFASLGPGVGLSCAGTDFRHSTKEKALLLLVFISVHLSLLTTASLMPAGPFTMAIKAKRRYKIAPVIIGLDLTVDGGS